MNRYPLWINVLVLVVILGGALFALPNVFGDDPALQITREDGNPLTEIAVAQVTAALDEEEIGFFSADLDDGAIVVRFGDVGSQLQGSEILGDATAVSRRRPDARAQNAGVATPDGAGADEPGA